MRRFPLRSQKKFSGGGKMHYKIGLHKTAHNIIRDLVMEHAGMGCQVETNLHQKLVNIKSSLTFKISPHFSGGGQSPYRTSRKSAPET